MEPAIDNLTAPLKLIEGKEMASQPHAVLFPFMSKGHTIPLLHFARLLYNHRTTITVTIFTTQANKSFISHSLSDLPSTAISIICLPFPSNIPGVPPGVESTDKLPSMSLFIPFVNATKLMQLDFEDALQKLVISCPVSFILSDAFFHWTMASASKFKVPRLSFYGMSNYATAVSAAVGPFLSGPESNDGLITVPDFPWIKVSRNDFSEPFNQRYPGGPYMDFIWQVTTSTAESYGVVINSFYELEPLFSDYWNTKFRPKAWCVGPFCLAEPKKIKAISQKSAWLLWLDEKLAQGKTVMYVAFGSQVEFPEEQLMEIAFGLESSKVNFLWVVRRNQELIDGFEERVKEKGLVLREWVDQREILRHECVQGFLSHCGWNSVMESISAKVPILAWPVMADQPLNARMVVDELKVGLRVETGNGSARGFVKREGLEKMAKELMDGEMGKQARRNVEEYGDSAKKALDKGGSSWCNLEALLDELCNPVP